LGAWEGVEGFRAKAGTYGWVNSFGRGLMGQRVSGMSGGEERVKVKIMKKVEGVQVLGVGVLLAGPSAHM
jgi:hypothetical protein